MHDTGRHVSPRGQCMKCHSNLLLDVGRPGMQGYGMPLDNPKTSPYYICGLECSSFGFPSKSTHCLQRKIWPHHTSLELCSNHQYPNHRYGPKMARPRVSACTMGKRHKLCLHILAPRIARAFAPSLAIAVLTHRARSGSMSQFCFIFPLYHLNPLSRNGLKLNIVLCFVCSHSESE